MINTKDSRLLAIKTKAQELAALIAEFENAESDYLITARIHTSDTLDSELHWVRQAIPVLTVQLKTEVSL